MTSATDQPRSSHGLARALGLFAVVLVCGATAALALTEEARWLRLGIIAALWAALGAAFIASKYRKQAVHTEETAAEAQQVYELELEREIAARREYELEIEAETRAKVEAEQTGELQALREELQALRQSLESLVGGEVLFERVALTAQASRMRSFNGENQVIAPVKYEQTQLDAAEVAEDSEDAEPEPERPKAQPQPAAAKERDESPTQLMERLRDVGQGGIPREASIRRREVVTEYEVTMPQPVVRPEPSQPAGTPRAQGQQASARHPHPQRAVNQRPEHQREAPQRPPQQREQGPAQQAESHRAETQQRESQQREGQRQEPSRALPQREDPQRAAAEWRQRQREGSPRRDQVPPHRTGWQEQRSGWDEVAARERPPQRRTNHPAQPPPHHPDAQGSQRPPNTQQQPTANEPAAPRPEATPPSSQRRAPEYTVPEHPGVEYPQEQRSVPTGPPRPSADESVATTQQPTQHDQPTRRDSESPERGQPSAARASVVDPPAELAEEFPLDWTPSWETGNQRRTSRDLSEAFPSSARERRAELDEYPSWASAFDAGERPNQPEAEQTPVEPPIDTPAAESAAPSSGGRRRKEDQSGSDVAALAERMQQAGRAGGRRRRAESDDEPAQPGTPAASRIERRGGEAEARNGAVESSLTGGAQLGSYGSYDFSEYETGYDTSPDQGGYRSDYQSGDYRSDDYFDYSSGDYSSRDYSSGDYSSGDYSSGRDFGVGYDSGYEWRNGAEQGGHTGRTGHTAAEPRPERAESGGGRRRRAEGEPPWEGLRAWTPAGSESKNGSSQYNGSHAKPAEPAPESEAAPEPAPARGSRAAGRSVSELLAAHGGGQDAPRRRRRKED